MIVCYTAITNDIQMQAFAFGSLIYCLKSVIKKLINVSGFLPVLLKTNDRTHGQVVLKLVLQVYAKEKQGHLLKIIE